MTKQMKNLTQLMKQAEKMQSQMMETQKKMEEQEVEGESGGGLVKIVINCKHEMRTIKIDKSLFNPDDSEMLEDLIIAAFNDAKQKADNNMSEEMGKITGGLPFKFPF